MLKISFFKNILAYPGYAIFTTLIKGLKSMEIERIDDQVQLLDWWARMENQMCENVADEKSRRMMESLTVYGFELRIWNLKYSI